jgi:D-lyxose ketol-isomerase
MKRSEINRYIREATAFFDLHKFNLPAWIKWSPGEWAVKGAECDEIRNNQLGWDITDFSKGNFLHEGLTLITVRNGNVKRDNKTYCEKIMMVRVNQITPVHFHWKKMEDIINRAGGTLCMKLWKATKDEKPSDESFHVQIDGVRTHITPSEVLRLYPGQSISFEPYIYHTFWAEKADCMVGEVSTVNDDANDNRFLEESGRFSKIEEDEAAEFLLCNEYITHVAQHP